MARLGFLAIGLTAFSLIGCGGSAPVQVPKTYSDFNSPDGSFAVSYPTGWEVDSNQGPNSSWVKIRSGSALIHVRSDPAASLLDDARGGRTADNSAPSPELAPVHAIHEMGLDGAPDDYGSYQETPAGTQELDIRMGPARYSEFTGTSGFGGSSVHGYRVTAIGSKRGVHAVCVCAEADWPKLRRIYDRVIRSIKRGQEE